MRINIFLTLLGPVIFFSCTAPVQGKNGVVYRSPHQYNNYIVDRQTRIAAGIMEFGRMVNSDLDSTVQLLHRNADTTDLFIHDIEGMPAYKGDSSLRNAAINIFKFYKRIFLNEYMSIVEIKRKGYPVSDEDARQLKKIVNDISVDEEKLDKDFHNAQKDFAEKNHMLLTKNKLQKELDKD